MNSLRLLATGLSSAEVFMARPVAQPRRMRALLTPPRFTQLPPKRLPPPRDKDPPDKFDRRIAPRPKQILLCEVTPKRAHQNSRPGLIKFRVILLAAKRAAGFVGSQEYQAQHYIHPVCSTYGATNLAPELLGLAKGAVGSSSHAAVRLRLVPKTTTFQLAPPRFRAAVALLGDFVGLPVQRFHTHGWKHPTKQSGVVGRSVRRLAMRGAPRLSIRDRFQGPEINTQSTQPFSDQEEFRRRVDQHIAEFGDGAARAAEDAPQPFGSPMTPAALEAGEIIRAFEAASLASLPNARLILAAAICLEGKASPAVVRLPESVGSWGVVGVVQHPHDVDFTLCIPFHDPPDAGVILRGLSSALQYLQGQGICHNNIKPANIAYSTARGAVLLNFGLASSEGDSRKAGGSPCQGDASRPVGILLTIANIRNVRSTAGNKMKEWVGLVGEARRSLDIQGTVERVVHLALEAKG
ncbi:hypothetical protein GGTG_04953 [Gaeumannomyces tritici R3-111a-1]|uniref:Protein kinase domain-containing protein n=1 Tax=Gaeumannomyces tritici (strain R3-111a-1) TaxID=644352 RepID=J3NUJ7_GAET3|nr:hypothetical protein GGTG_04953 [Gaeumannomyces tritici R3-111a-1]EJT79870.1 hypothetical protein GGTG_04953 [Gaeumannomyces tritici R3-111a-1]